ncbi:hypothetical protein ElyMa_002770400 [Elysia marginata]|uniref:Uncharacterized protein n=1 Tax=Elysia marginata TaxID=1093978 RepID=A0AAV4HNZ1_9GAST|nr:hypothetical protein ElyMa_002770400 [Elysia marginata]
MATSLNIHIDKENATPSFIPNKGGKGLLTQATPRKALYDVNQDRTGPNLQRSNWKDEGFTKPTAETLKPLRKKSNTPLATKPVSTKKVLLQENKNAEKKEVKPTQQPASTKTSKPKKKVIKKPAPTPDEEDGYDSDTIWPRSERLSTHIHSILSWRPSCFMGNDLDCDDLDSSLSDVEIPDQIIMEKPPAFMDIVLVVIAVVAVVVVAVRVVAVKAVAAAVVVVAVVAVVVLLVVVVAVVIVE